MLSMITLLTSASSASRSRSNRCFLNARSSIACGVPLGGERLCFSTVVSVAGTMEKIYDLFPGNQATDPSPNTVIDWSYSNRIIHRSCTARVGSRRRQDAARDDDDKRHDDDDKMRHDDDDKKRRDDDDKMRHDDDDKKKDHD